MSTLKMIIIMSGDQFLINASTMPVLFTPSYIKILLNGMSFADIA